MTEESDTRKLAGKLDVLEPHEIVLAEYLMRYYRHSFRVRGAPLLRDNNFDPPIVRELINLLLWCAGGFGIIESGEHMLSLNDIIQHNAEKINELVEQGKKSGYSSDLLEKIAKLVNEMESADTLMERISGNS